MNKLCMNCEQQDASIAQSNKNSLNFAILCKAKDKPPFEESVRLY